MVSQSLGESKLVDLEEVSCGRRKYAHRICKASVATKLVHATIAAHHHLDRQAHRTFIASLIAGRDTSASKPQSQKKRMQNLPVCSAHDLDCVPAAAACYWSLGSPTITTFCKILAYRARAHCICYIDHRLQQSFEQLLTRTNRFNTIVSGAPPS